MKVVNAVTNLDSGANIIKSNIPEITSLHNFKFTEDALVVWKAYNIGEGKISHDFKICIIKKGIYT